MSVAAWTVAAVSLGLVMATSAVGVVATRRGRDVDASMERRVGERRVTRQVGARRFRGIHGRLRATFRRERPPTVDRLIRELTEHLDPLNERHRPRLISPPKTIEGTLSLFSDGSGVIATDGVVSALTWLDRARRHGHARPVHAHPPPRRSGHDPCPPRGRGTGTRGQRGPAWLSRRPSHRLAVALVGGPPCGRAGSASSDRLGAHPDRARRRLTPDVHGVPPGQPAPLKVDLVPYRGWRLYVEAEAYSASFVDGLPGAELLIDAPRIE